MNRRIRSTTRRTTLAVLMFLVASVLTVAAQQPPQQGTPPPQPPPAPVIARVEGRPITQSDFDRVGQPYFQRLRDQMKTGYTPDVQKMANRNVLDELVRRELLVVEAQRQKIVASEAETDLILQQDPFFYTNGKFDRGKFIQFKISPGSNYIGILPKLRELAAANKLDSTMRARSMPSPATVRAEWAKRNDQVRFKFLALGARDISLDGEANEPEIAAYYAAHPDQFERRPKARLRYIRLSLPPADDSVRASAQADSMERGRAMVASLKKGTSLDSIAVAFGGPLDTGLFDLPPTNIPGMGLVPELVPILAHADSDTTVRVIGPVVAADAVIVGEVAERQTKTLPPLREVIGDVKRRADADKRRSNLDRERNAYYEAHRDTYRTPRAQITRVVLAESAPPKAPLPKDVERWYSEHGRSLFATNDSVTVAPPPLNDSLRQAVAARLTEEARAAQVARALATVSTGWRAGRDPHPLARTIGATAETLTIVRGSLTDSVFTVRFADSLLADAHTAGVGKIEGPRSFGVRNVLWRVDRYDTTYVPPMESVRGKIERAVFDEKRMKDEEDGRAYFDAHKTTFKTKPKFVIQSISQRILPPDSVKVPETEIRKYYDSHKDTYRHEEEVRARHILIGTRPGQTPEPRARNLADSLYQAIVKGADFADLARRFSADPGSGANGGDLGFFGRGRMVKEFSDTSFALAPGAVSHPTKTQFGWHIIKVEEKRPAGMKPLDEVRQEIHGQLAQSLGDSSAARAARAMRRRIVVGADPAKVAPDRLKTSAEFASTEPVPEIGFVQGLGPDLETLPLAKWAPKVYRSGASYLIIKPLRKIPPRQATFEEVQSQAIEEMKTAKKKEILAGKVAAIRGQLTAGASLDSVALLYGGLKDSGPQTRVSAFVPGLGAEPRLITKAFALKPNAMTDTLETSTGVAWLKVEEKKTQQGASFAKDAPAIRIELQTKNYNDWVEKKKKTLRVEILRADLREVPQPITRTVTMGG